MRCAQDRSGILSRKGKSCDRQDRIDPLRRVPQMQMSMKMSWRALGVFVAVIAFCSGLAAQNEPFLGIWALNVDQTSNYPMKSQLIINVPSPDSPDAFISMRASINKNGQSSTEIHPVA